MKEYLFTIQDKYKLLRSTIKQRYWKKFEPIILSSRMIHTNRPRLFRSWNKNFMLRLKNKWLRFYLESDSNTSN